ALQQGVHKLQQKIADTEAELKLLVAAQTVPPVFDPAARDNQDAANAAIEKAKAKAVSLAAMSDSEKRAEQIKSLEARLQKARERLARAEEENDPNIEAFRSGA